MADKETLRKNKLLQELFETCLYDEPGTHWRGYADEDPDDEGPDEGDEAKAEWREEDHPREPAGSSTGGQFVSDGGGTEEEDPWEAAMKERAGYVKQLEKYGVSIQNLDTPEREHDDVMYLLKSAIAACEKMEQAGMTYFDAEVYLDMEPLEVNYPKSNSTAHYVSHALTIQFNRNPQGSSMRDREVYIREAKEPLPWVVGGKMGAVGTFIHEFGHHVDYALQDERSSRVRTVRQEVSSAFYNALPKDAPASKGSISRYAKTNDVEFFAESFVAAFSGDKEVIARLPTGTYDALRDQFRKLGVLKK